MGYGLANRVALITGAASGIGAALAREFASRGAAVALVDRDADGLRRIAHRVGAAASTYRLDITDRAALAALPDEVMARHGRIDVLVNNAGIAAMGRFDETSLDTFDQVMAINFGGTVALTKAVLPYLRADGRIANISSIFGILAPPGQVPYVASKFAVRGFTEALRHELADTGIKVTCVHPGGVRTAIAKHAVVADGIPADRAAEAKAAFGDFLKLEPEAAARRIVSAIERGQPRLLVGSDARFGDLLVRALPAAYARVMALAMGGMKKHIGRMEPGGLPTGGSVTAISPAAATATVPHASGVAA